MKAKHVVSDVIDLLSHRLDPLIQTRLDEHLQGLDWTVILEELDAAKKKHHKIYSRTDLQAQLRVLTERLGAIGFPFDDQSRVVSTLGSELRIVRNDFAHGGSFTWIEAMRAADFGLRLLEKLGDEFGAERCEGLRDRALYECVSKEPATVEEPVEEAAEPEDDDAVVVAEPDAVEPPEDAFETESQPAKVPAVGSRRGEFEPWPGGDAGPRSVIENLPKKSAKTKLRAVAAEIVEFEGPVEIHRLARLVAASFSWHRVPAKRLAKIVYQVKQVDGVVVDDFGFAWSGDVDREAWSEFRPQSGSADRTFDQVSPHEVANAYRFVAGRRPDCVGDELDREVLAIFGRSKMTASAREKLDDAKSLLS